MYIRADCIYTAHDLGTASKLAGTESSMVTFVLVSRSSEGRRTAGRKRILEGRRSVGSD